MILSAGLLVLTGLAMFVGGLVTGTTALYWGCVAACGLAAVLLVVNRVFVARSAADQAGRATAPPTVRGPSSGGHRAAGPSSGGHRAAGPSSGGHRAAGPSSDGQRTVGPTSGDHRTVGGPASGGNRAVEPEGAGADVPAAEPQPADREAPAWPVPPDDDGAPDRWDDAPTGAHAAVPGGLRGATGDGEPAEEDVEVTDLLLVVDLADDVLVVDEHPRYHVAGCVHLAGQATIPLPMVEARADGFTPCGTCRPVRSLADVERARRRASRGY